MADARKPAFAAFATPDAGVLIVFCEEGLKFGSATRKAVAPAEAQIKRAAEADKFTGKSRAFGFVEMPDTEAAKKAIAELDNGTVEGRTIRVMEAKPKEEKPRANGGGFRNNSGGGYNGGGCCYGGGYDNDGYHPVAAAMVVGATAAVVSNAVAPPPPAPY